MLVASSLGAVLAVAPAAPAATRLAAPFSTNTSGDCLVTTCRLDRALSQAQPGDVVTLEAGPYAVSYRAQATGAVTIQPATAGTQPRLIGQAGLAHATLELSNGAAATGLQIESSGPAGLSLASGARGIGLEVFADATVSTSVAVKLSSAPANTALVNSVARTQSSHTAVDVIDGATPGGASLLNVTAVATGAQSWGVTTNMMGQSPVLKNSIVRAKAKALHGRSGSQPIAVSHTNLVTQGAANWTDGAGNQKDVAVAFADEAAGNLRVPAGAPTVDAGATDTLTTGTSDPDGRGRSIGTAPDIGAFELDPGQPVVTDPTPPPAGTPDTASEAGAGNSPGDTSTNQVTPVSASPADRPAAAGAAPVVPATAAAGVLPAAAPPVLGASVGVAAVAGRPLVRLPGATRFVPLDRAASIPVGSTVDATQGRVELASVRDAAGRTQTGRFWGGRFVVRQRKARGAYTELVLAGGSFAGCPRAPRAGRAVASAAAARKKRRRSAVRSLWGSDHKGRFRTRGRNSVATVRGTVWLVQDRCDGTLTRVRSGSVEVRENGGRTTVVRAGGSHLAARGVARSGR